MGRHVDRAQDILRQDPPEGIPKGDLLALGHRHDVGLDTPAGLFDGKGSGIGKIGAARFGSDRATGAT
jgi:hypothetical protein